nr:MAG: ORF1 [Torque teno virus]
MAWRWWKRKRRWWWRKRWTRGRLRRRWPRRSRRRPRRRRVRRRRRWRRGRPRRRLYRRGRRYRRKRKRAKITIRQWQPAMTRRCFIRGYMPALICGWGAYASNYTSHLEDKIIKGPYGGGHATFRFSLQVLYEEHLKHHNYWTRSNQDLELALYYGCTIKFYRSPDTDFIVTYQRKSPLGGNILTGPSLHPAEAMLSKNKILIPSLLTKPKGKKTVKINIAPPTLFVHKWYFQKDICDLTLFNLNVVAADLRFPFCSPQTDNVCITFQVLAAEYNNFLSITEPAVSKEKAKEFAKKFLEKAIPDTPVRHANVLNTFRTEGCFSHPQLKKYNSNLVKLDETTYFHTPDGLWGDAIYNYNAYGTGTTQQEALTPQKIREKIISNMESYYKKLEQESTIVTKGCLCHCHLTGIFSPPFLNIGRIAREFPGLYNDIIYNPWVDKGKGNKIWMDSLSKSDNKYKEGQSILLMQDMPLYILLNGYVDWAKKERNNWGLATQYRVMVVCPYTYPRLYVETDPYHGYVIYSESFGAGQMPDKNPYVPVTWRGKWYPHILHQESVINDIVLSGPFAPKDTKPVMQLNMKYSFRFTWGGNPISTQIVKDPCTQPTFEIPGGGNIPRRVQVINPKVLGPSYSFRSFDLRRDMFSGPSLKRVSEQQETSEFLFSGGKRPRIDLPKYVPPEEDFNIQERQQREQRPWTSESESEAEAQEETQAGSVREQLQQQLQEQLQLRRGLKCLFEQLVRTQQGVHVDPCLV